MFGESDSESPRVPSPWDSLISTPPSRASSSSPPTTSIINLIPRLVPENDEGNVEYKLQLLSPSPARFTRLVTQLKWRLLEGGGQAYYELGVADSGALVGLPRPELEESLETLEMMAGEIGASVIVVKEVEVPALIAGLAASHPDTWNGQRKQRAPRPSSSLESESSISILTNTSTTNTETETETETELSTASEIDDNDFDDMSNTIVIEKSKADPIAIFSMESDLDPYPAGNTNIEPNDHPAAPPPYFTIDLEIASVFKPRPVRTRPQSQNALTQPPSKCKRLKKIKHITDHVKNCSTASISKGTTNTHSEVMPVDPESRALYRRAMRDRKREERRRALLSAVAPPSNAASNSPYPPPGDQSTPQDLPAEKVTANTLVSDLAALHVSIDETASQTCLAQSVPEVSPDPLLQLVSGSEVNDDQDDDDNDDDADLFPSGSRSQVTTAFQVETSSAGWKQGSESQLPQNRLIVEALVVRKMSLDEAFLDFEGFG